MEKNKLPKYDALSIAKYLLSLDPKREYFNDKRTKNKINLRTITVGNFRLHQILYLLQIFHYLKYKEPLFEDKLYAWENGIITYKVHTHFWGLYQNVNDKVIKDVEDEETKEFIAKCFNYLKTLSDRTLQEFSHNDPTWSTTWARSDKPDINSVEENLEVYKNCYSRWLQEAKL